MADVVPFRPTLVSVTPTPPPPTEEGDPALTTEQISMYHNIGVLGQYLLENRDNIKYFVAVVAQSDPTPESPDNLSHQVLTTQISLPALALVNKILDSTLTNRLVRTHTHD